MNTADRRAARAALDPARHVVARADASRSAEDLAADLIETWAAVETALRALIGGSALGGQALIREARQRQLLTFGDANALAEFHAVRQRLDRPGSTPSPGDVAAARAAFNALDASLTERGAPDEGVGGIATGGPPQVVAPIPDGAPTAPLTFAGRFRRLPLWAVGAAGLGIIALVVGLALLLGRARTDPALARGIELYQRGQREQAVGEFNRAARANPQSATPWIFLGRIAREGGDLTLALEQLRRAVELEPRNAVALREMGALMLTTGENELARRFYVRAVEANPADQTSQGYLGCSLARLGRVTEAANWLARAGPGPWHQCASSPGAGVARPA